MFYTEYEMKYKLLLDMEFVKNKGYLPCAGFIKGSQNYQLEVASSDLDRVILVCPSFKDLVNNTNLNKEYEDLKGKINVLDFRSYIDSLIKGSIFNFEYLLSPYNRIDLNAKELYGLYVMKNCILRINPIYTSKSINGLFDSYSNKLWKYCEGEIVGYNKKSLVGIMRTKDIMCKYKAFIDTSNSLIDDFDLFIPKAPKKLRILKEKEIPLDEVKEIWKDCNNYIKNTIFDYFVPKWNNYTEGQKTVEWLKEFRIKFIKEFLNLK